MARRYAVLWRTADGPTYVGGLELSERTLVLEGRAPNRDATKDAIPRTDIRTVQVVRALPERLSGRPTLVLTLASGEAYRVASVDGPGTLGELARELARENGVRS